MSAYIQIGTIAATQGWKGEVILVHELGNELNSDNISVLFIERNKNNFIPYFIKSIRQKKNTEAVLKLEDIDSKESARILLRKKVYVTRDIFDTVAQPDSQLYYLGFTIVDKKEKELGQIAEIVQLPGQLVARILEADNELLIPLTEQTIEKTDLKKKIIYVHLPDGLIDIYRQDDSDSK